MKINKHEQKYKQALSLERERRDLWDQIRNIKLIKLDRPIFAGYVKTLAFKKDSVHHGMYQKVKETVDRLKIVPVYSKTKDFIEFNYKGEKTGQILKPFINSLQDPRFSFYYSEDKRAEMNIWIDEHKKCLQAHGNYYKCDKYCGELNNKTFRPHYILDPYYKTFFLDEVIKERYYTHYKPVDGDLETRLAEIDAKFDNENLWPKLYGRLYEKGEDRRDLMRIKYLIQDNKMLVEDLE